ncbi:MAG: nuclear transport factor 2 family protein [Burkholderiales bacterium]|nr:nuclear transport factor 2 family protein [Burkholderiales bacterium]
MSEATPQTVAADLAQAQLDAYNARDIEGFLACYADDVKIYAYPDTLMCEGKEAMRSRYAGRFSDPNMYAYVAHRTTMGNTVLDHEYVRTTVPLGLAVLQVMAVYQIEGGKIAEVRFIYGPQEVGGQMPDGSGAPALALGELENR